MFNEFRNAYPQGSLISELLNIYHGKYVVRVLAIANNITLATGLAAEDTLEMAEDRARVRALSAIGLDSIVQSHPSDPAVSKQSSSSTASPTPHSKASDPSAEGQTYSHPLPMSVPVPDATDLPKEYSRSAISNSADEWMSSSQQDLVESDLLDRKEAIASGGDRQTSVESLEVESLEADPIFSPVSGTTVSALLSQPEPGSVNPTELETHDLSQTQQIHPFESAESQDQSSLFNTEERKTKIAETTIEIQRLNWSTQQGRDFLQQRYHCRARSQLSDEQLLDFLHYLKAQPNPT